MDNWIIWLALTLGCLVLEGLSRQLFSIWFALGGLVALAADLFHAPLWLQIVLFLAVTVVSLLATRPLARRMHQKLEPTNADRYVDKLAHVLEAIDNVNGTGQIKVEGQIWSARSADGEPIPAGETVRTLEIQGAKLIVARSEPSKA